MHPAASACDHAFGREVVRSATDAGRANAAIFVADDNPTFFVDSGIEEVEEVAAGASIANAAPLDGIAWSDVLGRPGLTAVKRSSYVEIPHTWKRRSRTAIFTVAAVKVSSRGFAAEKRKGSAKRVTSYYCRKYSVNNRPAIDHYRTDIGVANPVKSFVMRHGDVRVAVIGLITEIQRAVSRYPDRWVARGLMTAIGGIVFLAITSRARDDSNVPGYAIVLRHHDRLLARFVECNYPAASLVGHVDGSVSRRHFDAPVQTGAISDGEHGRGCLAEKKSAVIAPKRACVGDALRSVVDRVWIKRSGVRQRRMIWAATESLVVDVGRNNAVARSKVVSIVISNVDRRTSRG